MRYLWKRDQRSQTATDSLRQLASAGNYDYVVEHISSDGGNLNDTDKYGRTILHWAVMEGKLELVTSLLERQDIEIGTTDCHGASIDSSDEEKGRTALHWAAYCGSEEMVKELVLMGADVTAKDHDVVEVMLHSLGERDAAILAMQGEYDETPLHVATFHNDAAMIKVMMKHLGEKSDAILMKQDGGKRTALHLAAQRDIAAPVKVRTLLECLKENAGAMMMIPDRWGWTPLHHAAKCGNTGAFEVMLECLKEKASTVMVMLDWDNRTPLHWAASRCDAGTVKMILEYLETEVACPLMAMGDIHNRTPLHLAAKGGHTATVKVMLEYLGEDASAKIILGDDEGNTPLHWAAAENDNEATVVAILENLAETLIADSPMDIMDHKKCTPLHLAARRGKVPIIKAMLRYLKKAEGASCLTMMDDDGMLPLEYPVAQKLVQEAEFTIETGPKQETDKMNR
ncbi:hypothetical protein ARSEF1564_002994 [Beauveria bassiana]